METFSYEVWKTDLLKTEQLIRALKDIMRESGQPRKYGFKSYTKPDGTRVAYLEIEWDLAWAKRQATLLYATRAHKRARVHKKGSTLEEQADFIKG